MFGGRTLEITSSPVEDNMNGTNGNSVSVLLADDSAIVRKAIKGILKEEPSIKLLGEADCFGQAISKAVELRPDVILLDLHMPDDNKFEIEFVKSQFNLCGSRVLAMSLLTDGTDSTRVADELGAAALLDKVDLHQTLIPAILNRVGS
jgi:two-component system chemotaxis response regulator CheB